MNQNRIIILNRIIYPLAEYWLRLVNLFKK
jgi:hypothetical protein